MDNYPQDPYLILSKFLTTCSVRPTISYKFISYKFHPNSTTFVPMDKSPFSVFVYQIRSMYCQITSNISGRDFSILKNVFLKKLFASRQSRKFQHGGLLACPELMCLLLHLQCSTCTSCPAGHVIPYPRPADETAPQTAHHTPPVSYRLLLHNLARQSRESHRRICRPRLSSPHCNRSI